MKKLRKIVSLLLAVAMLMSLCAVQVWADDGSITIYNTSTESQSYSVYKLFDLTYDSTNNAYVYTITTSSDWYNFFDSGDGSDYVTLTAVTGSTTTYYVEWKGDDSTTRVQELGQLASAYADSEGITENDFVSISAGDNDTIDSLELGYYLVTSSMGSLVALDSTATTATIYDKNAKPTLEKLVSTDSTNYDSSCTADLSDTLYYQVKIIGIDDVTTLVLHDALPDGYAISGDVTVTLYTDATTYVVLDDNDDYDYTTSNCSANPAVTGCSFEIDFADLLTQTTSGNYYTYVLNASDPSAAYIMITYAVTVDDASEVSISEAGETPVANTNTAVLAVSTDPEDNKTETANTYIYELYIYKYASGNESTALSGAVFTLQDSSDNYAVADGDSSGNYTLTRWTTDSTQATSFTTSSTGYIYIKGLDLGIYTLTETTAPTGYKLPSSSTDVTLSDSSYTLQTTGFTQYDGSSNYALGVANSTSSAMPTTGGIGTTIFYVVGGILVLGAVILIITRKRMKDDEE